MFKNAAFAMLNASCGAGKSLAGIKLILEKQLPVIIIAPGHHLCEQWRREILKNDSDADIWVHHKPTETKQGEVYRDRFLTWLEGA